MRHIKSFRFFFLAASIFLFDFLIENLHAKTLTRPADYNPKPGSIVFDGIEGLDVLQVPPFEGTDPTDPSVLHEMLTGYEFTVEEVGTIACGNVPRGYVVFQNPSGDAVVKDPRIKIKLTTSTGADLGCPRKKWLFNQCKNEVSMETNPLFLRKCSTVTPIENHSCKSYERSYISNLEFTPCIERPNRFLVRY